MPLCTDMSGLGPSSLQELSDQILNIHPAAAKEGVAIVVWLVFYNLMKGGPL